MEDPHAPCRADIVLCTLFDDASVKAVVLGKDLLAVIPPAAVFASLSTISLELALALEAASPTGLSAAWVHRSSAIQNP